MLEGAEYEVRDADGLLYCTMTTDRTGYAVSCDLPVGTYYVREIVPPAGFILSDEIIEVKLTTDDKTTLVFERTNVPNEVILKKTDLTTGKPVYGATIEIKNAAGEVVFNEETDLNGEIILMELPAGRYTYTETQAAEGFTINTGSFEFVVDYYGHVTGTTEITDEPICLQIDKVDLFTGEPFPLVEFQLRNMDDQVIRTILVDQIREVGGPRSVVVSNNNDFRVWAKDGEDFFHVGDDGHVEFRYFPAGEYKLVEVPPTGYIAEDEISVVLTDRNGVSNPKMVRVENRPTGVKIKKIDAGSGNPLMGAGFEIKVKSDNGFETLTFVKNSDGSYFYDPQGNVTELMVDGMGEITLYGMPLGDIWVEETTVPDGYFPISAQKLTITKEMNDAAPYEMTIKNNKFVKLGMNSDWWEFPALCGGVLLLLAGGVMAIIRIRKKRSYR